MQMQGQRFLNCNKTCVVKPLLYAEGGKHVSAWIPDTEAPWTDQWTGPSRSKVQTRHGNVIESSRSGIRIHVTGQTRQAGPPPDDVDE